MSLQLILGSSGEGKSYELYHKIIEDSQKNKNKNYIIIVPEQFTLQTQKDIVSMHPNHGIMNIDVLSFLRLSYHILEETGGGDMTVLEETGKSMLVRKALEEEKEELEIFKADIKKQGFTKEMKSLISEFLQYSIKIEDLEKMLQLSEKKPLLQAKLSDTLKVYTRFRELLEHKYITAEEVLEVLCDVIEKSEIIKNSIICFDGFTGFTPNQYKLLEQLMILCPKIYVTVTMDRREKLTRKMEAFHLFHLSRDTIDRLYRIAKNTGTEILEPWYAGKEGCVPYRFQNSEALACLEHNLFRYHWEKYTNKQDDIRMFCGANPKSEIIFTVSEINRLIRDEGYRYRDIAVVTGDVESYAGTIEREYEKAGFSYFVDYKKDIRQNPFVEVVGALLNMFNTNFSYEGVLRYLRSGMIQLTDGETDLLENFIIACGIRGYKTYSRPFKSRSKRKQEEFHYEQLNEIRVKMMEPLADFYEKISGGKHTVLDITRALYDFIIGEELYERIEDYLEKFEQEEKPLLAKEFQQIYQILMDLFDKMVELLGAEEVTLKEYEELLDTGLSEIKVGLIPPGVDQIVVGDIERTRLKDIKALFFIGVNDGVIPKAGSSGGILSDMERNMLKEADIELAPTQKENAFTEQFYLYLNLTRPQNKLYLTYCQVGADGKAKKPSYLIGKMKKIFTNLEVEEEETYRQDMVHILDGDCGMEVLLEGLRQYPEKEQGEFWKELFSYYKEGKTGDKLRHLIDGVYYTNEEKGLSRAVVRALYGDELTNSVTRLEQFASCAFAHFMVYGLGLKERKQFQLAIPDIGDLFHASIENFSKAIKKQGFTWHDLSKEEMEGQRDLFVKEAVIQAVEERGSDVIFSSRRSEYLVTRLERMTSRTIWALCQQIAQGDFEPAGYEIAFAPLDNRESATMVLNDHATMRLKGRIDRIDECEDDENLYLKVIDYKSGGTAFDLQKIYYGLQLQLVVYLDAAIELAGKTHPVKKIIPAGIFYYNINDPVIEKVSGRPKKEEIEEDILKELKVNGLVNSDKEILMKLDHIFEEEKSVKSKVIPVELTAKGKFSAYSSVAGEKQFHDLRRFVRKKMEQYGKEIVDGKTDIDPYQLNKKTACDYCRFDGICGFDQKLPGNHYRNLKKIDQEKIWEELRGEDGVDKGTTEGN